MDDKGVPLKDVNKYNVSVDCVKCQLKNELLFYLIIVTHYIVRCEGKF